MRGRQVPGGLLDLGHDLVRGLAYSNRRLHRHAKLGGLSSKLLQPFGQELGLRFQEQVDGARLHPRENRALSRECSSRLGDPQQLQARTGYPRQLDGGLHRPVVRSLQAGRHEEAFKHLLDARRLCALNGGRQEKNWLIAAGQDLLGNAAEEEA